MPSFLHELPRLLANDPAFTTLNVDASNISDQDTQLLASALECNDTLTHLSVAANSIGADGAAHLAKAVARNQGALTLLNLSGNKIGNDGATALAAAMQRSSSLAKLQLANCEIGDEGASMLAEALLRNPRLVQLDMRYNRIGSKGASNLAAVLAADKSLTMLGLYSNRIGNEGVTMIAHALKKNTRLIATCLGENGIGDEGAQKVAEALSSNAALTAIDLRMNRIGEVGRLKIAQALRMRPPPSTEFADMYPGLKLITGMQLRRAAAQLAMPPSATSWNDSAILRYMWHQQDRSLAFWMLTHLRLGKGCLWAGLDSSILQMVLDHPIHYSEDLNEFDNEIAVDDEEEGQDDNESELDRVV